MSRTYHFGDKFYPVEGEMQQARGGLGFSKHRACRFHRVGTAKHVLMELAREASKPKKKIRQPMFASVREAFAQMVKR